MEANTKKKSRKKNSDRTAPPFGKFPSISSRGPAANKKEPKKKRISIRFQRLEGKREKKKNAGLSRRVKAATIFDFFFFGCLIERSKEPHGNCFFFFFGFCCCC